MTRLSHNSLAFSVSLSSRASVALMVHFASSISSSPSSPFRPPANQFSDLRQSTYTVTNTSQSIATTVHTILLSSARPICPSQQPQWPPSAQPPPVSSPPLALISYAQPSQAAPTQPSNPSPNSAKPCPQLNPPYPLSIPPPSKRKTKAPKPEPRPSTSTAGLQTHRPRSQRCSHTH